MFLAIKGDLTVGFTFYGPFTDQAVANDWVALWNDTAKFCVVPIVYPTCPNLFTLTGPN